MVALIENFSFIGIDGIFLHLPFYRPVGLPDLHWDHEHFDFGILTGWPNPK